MTLISRSIFLSRVKSCVTWACKSLGRTENYVDKYNTNLLQRNVKVIVFWSSAKRFHTCRSECAKLFVEVENASAHAWMEKSPVYSPTICKPIDFNHEIIYGNLEEITLQDWTGRSSSEILAAFKDASIISKNSCMQVNDPGIQNLINAFISNCNNLEDSEILTALQCLSLWPQCKSPKERPYFSMWTALDKECVKRSKEWSVSMCLLVADHWQILNLVRWSEYIRVFFKKVGRKLDKLKHHEFVQLMFYINLSRKLPVSASKFELTYAFENICETLSLEELSIAAMGFFKTQTKLRNTHVGDVLLSRLESSLRMGEPPVPDSITLAALLKTLRYIISPSSCFALKKMLDASLPHINSISLLGCLHVALIGSNIQVFHEASTNKVCQRFATEIENARLKDIERLALVLTLFNHDPNTRPCIYNTMVTDVRRRITEAEKKGEMWFEMERHGECLLRFLSYLSMRDIFPMDIIERAMDPSFLSHVYGESWRKIGREVLVLDQNIEIRSQHQPNNRLSPKLKENLVKKFSFTEMDEYKKGTAAFRFHSDILQTLEGFPGAQGKVKTWNLLPHFEQPDIVFCTDEGNNFLDVDLPKCGSSVFKSPSDQGIWHVVVLCGVNNTIKFSNKPNGPIVNKVRQLETLGYKTALVTSHEWFALKPEEKHNYLRKKLLI
ncbi:hypothetical protein J437_LFUL002237, partial [Ladona fulva]